MPVHRVTRYGHPVLRKVVEPVREVTPELVRLTDDMLETMVENRGVGLAANQIGIDLAIAVVGFQDVTLRMFNPRILEKVGLQRYEEGCLSVPGVHGDVTRSLEVTVAYTGVDGRETVETHEGHLARIVQHEVDHLNGIMIVTHLSAASRSLFEKTLKLLREQTHAELRSTRR